jgi:uncharacterized membrane-anchored protein
VCRRPIAGATNLRSRVGAPWSNQIDYGIDAVFVPEGRGRAIEAAIQSGQPVYAEIAIARSGRARVHDLIIGGRRVSDRP